MLKPVFEDRFDSEMRDIEPDFSRAKELMKGIVWVLCRKPDFGTCVHERDRIWMIPSIDVFEKPVAVYYTFTDTHLYFLSARIVDDSE